MMSEEYGMNDTIINNSRNFKFKKEVTILSWIAMIATVLGNITYFVQYNFEPETYTYELSIHFPSILSLFLWALTLAPCVLLVLYVSKFQDRFHDTIMVSAIFGLLAAIPLLSMIQQVIFGYYSLEHLLFNLTSVVLFVLSTISVLKGLSKKKIVIVAIAVSLIIELFSIIGLLRSMSWYMTSGRYLNLFVTPIRIIGNIALYVSLLVFSLHNRVPAILLVSAEKEKKITEKMLPEQALRVLQEKHELGLISDEEYQEQRAEIISNL